MRAGPPFSAIHIREQYSMESQSPYFRIDHDGHIAWLVFNRPEKRNTMTIEFFFKLGDIFKEFDKDPAVRVVIVRAEGKMFTAGLDLIDAQVLIQDTSAPGREKLRREVIRIQETMNAVERCRKPVIIAVHGLCLGGGVDLSCACDIRMASRDAVFSIRETRIGIVADVGTLQRIPTIVGQGWARELALTGRDFTAEEAYQMGFITRLCENRESLYAKAKKLAEEIANCPPMAVEGVKDVILYSRDKGIYPSLEYVAQKNAAILPSEDMVEAFAAFVEKRKPDFKGR
jgi:enoyl-CoA hydratase